MGRKGEVVARGSRDTLTSVIMHYYHPLIFAHLTVSGKSPDWGKVGGLIPDNKPKQWLQTGLFAKGSNHILGPETFFTIL